MSNSSDSAKVSNVLFLVDKLDASESGSSKCSLRHHGSGTGEPLSFEETASACMPASAAISSDVLSANAAAGTSLAARIMGHCNCHCSNTLEPIVNGNSAFIVHEETIDPIVEEEDDDGEMNDVVCQDENNEIQKIDPLCVGCKQATISLECPRRAMATSRSFNEKRSKPIMHETIEKTINKTEASGLGSSETKKRKSASSKLKSTGSLIGRKLLLTKRFNSSAATQEGKPKPLTLELNEPSTSIRKLEKAEGESKLTTATFVEEAATTATTTTVTATTDNKENAKTNYNNIITSLLRTTTI